MNSSQYFFYKDKAPRVRVTYDVEIGDNIEKRELPFVMGVVGDFCGHNKYAEYAEREFILINKNNFNDVMRGMAPNISMMLKSRKKIELVFHQINDFTPDGLVSNIPDLQLTLDQRQRMIDFVCLLDAYPKLGKVMQSCLNTGHTKDIKAAKSLAEQVGAYNDDPVKHSSRLNAIMVALNLLNKTTQNVYIDSIKVISDIDRSISDTIDEIIHNPEFIRIEASWRGLYDLVSQSKTNESLMIKVLSASEDEIAQDLSDGMSFEYSNLFRLIYENEYGVLGGTPFGCIIFDYYMSHSTPHLNMLRTLSKIAAIAHAPMLFGTSPEMLNIKSFKDLANKKSINDIFASSEYAAWHSLREIDDARYINMCLPHVLMREPYGDNNPVRKFKYVETLNHENNDGFCWGNPAYYMGIRITDAISKHGWAAAIRGTYGGVVTDLPTYTFQSSFGEIKFKSPLQTYITDRCEKELSENGFIALCHKKMTNQAIFFSGQSIQKAKLYNDIDATSNAAIAARMTYMLNASRFAHYAQMIMRDKIGSCDSAEDLRKYLQSWISQYVLLSDDATQELKCTYPLREALIYANETNTVGEYEIIMRMRPHFQMEGASVSVRFVSRIGQSS